MAAIPVGLQLYSLRDASKTDFLQCIRDAKAAGYDGVEFAGFYDKPAGEVKAVVDGEGLSIMGAHVGMDLLQPNKIDATLEYHLALGNRCLVVPWLAEPYRDTADACRRTADFFNRLIEEKLKPLGLETGYHTHHFDVQPFPDGAETTTIYDLLMKNTVPEFIMQVDVGNVVQAGACPVEYLKRYPGRAKQLHLKEYYPGKWNVPFAAGDVPWATVFGLANTVAGTREYIVEVERYWDDPLECARQDRAILRTWGV